MTRILTAILLLLSACSREQPEPAGVRPLFATFQQALLDGDREALRPLLTTESRQFLADLPLERSRGKQPLRVTAVHGARSRYVVEVLDPNRDDAPGHFIVVREAGELRVDLVATVTGQQQTVRHGPANWQIVPGGLDPATAREAEAAWRRGR